MDCQLNVMVPSSGILDLANSMKVPRSALQRYILHVDWYYGALVLPQIEAIGARETLFLDTVADISSWEPEIIEFSDPYNSLKTALQTFYHYLRAIAQSQVEIFTGSKAYIAHQLR